MRYFALLLLNAWDGYATTLGLLLGLVAEANPLLADMAHTNPMNLFWVKLIPVSAAIVVLYSCRRYRMVRIGSVAMLGIYGGIALMHCVTLGIV